jgi:hypothetical protein
MTDEERQNQRRRLVDERAALLHLTLDVIERAAVAAQTDEVLREKLTALLLKRIVEGG